MISDNQMDQFFRERMGNYSSPVPENMWNRIMEKKKRDSMLWLFFFRLMVIAVLLFGLTGGYFTFKQKTITKNSETSNSIVQQTPIVADSIKSKPSTSPLTKDQVQQTSATIQKEKADQNSSKDIHYFDAIDHRKPNTSNREVQINTRNSSQSISLKADSTTAVPITNKTLDKNDSLNKKSLAKSLVADSTKSNEVKKPGKQNKQKDGKWYLDLYASPDYPIVAPTPFDHTVSKLSYTIGIKINRTLGKHFSVKTGIQYSQINIIGDDSLFAGATLHIKRLDLPVLVGYSFGNGDLKTTINGGAIFNLYSSVSSVPAQNLFTPPPVQDYFEKNLGVSLYLGVNFEKKIKEKLALFVEPYYRYQLSSMTVPSVMNVKFIDIVGISLGARYYFKK